MSNKNPPYASPRGGAYTVLSSQPGVCTILSYHSGGYTILSSQPARPLRGGRCDKTNYAPINQELRVVRWSRSVNNFII